ncbi:hypothetical protein J1605_003392 [Eschrichtius robustus]|uniref:Adhesion G protein-coupled receptor A1 n=1 Tax=Eschrichtius robustus TaxID=9764 RepID=A0AB34HM86_ESCRO|nr:hypothetical protein J1605_003392 [Eschrichtius robustus]
MSQEGHTIVSHEKDDMHRPRDAASAQRLVPAEPDKCRNTLGLLGLVSPFPPSPNGKCSRIQDAPGRHQLELLWAWGGGVSLGRPCSLWEWGQHDGRPLALTASPVVTAGAAQSPGEFLHPVVYACTAVMLLCLLASAITYVVHQSAIRISRKGRHTLLNFCFHAALTFSVFAGGINRTKYPILCQAAWEPRLPQPGTDPKTASPDRGSGGQASLWQPRPGRCSRLDPEADNLMALSGSSLCSGVRAGLAS